MLKLLLLTEGRFGLGWFFAPRRSPGQDHDAGLILEFGSKCVAFLTTLDTLDKIDYVVDINPHRHGQFIPGIGKEIKSPEFLKEYQPHEVIIMNEIYQNEIQKMLDDLGVSSRIILL